MQKTQIKEQNNVRIRLTRLWNVKSYIRTLATFVTLLRRHEGRLTSTRAVSQANKQTSMNITHRRGRVGQM